MKYNKTYIIAIVTFILILAFAIVMMNLIKKNSECVGNPFTYAANLIVDNEGDVIYSLCSCQVNEVTFYFDNQGIYLTNPLANNSERGLELWQTPK